MAQTLRLTTTFLCSDGEEHNFSWNHANELPRSADVKALGQAMITNGSIFEHEPVELKSAKLVVTNTNEIDISE